MRRCTFLAMLLASCLAASCGGGSSGGSSSDSNSNSSSDSTFTTTTVTGAVAKGSVSVATVVFYTINDDGTKGDQLATTFTGSDGSFQVSWTVNSNPLLAVASGGSYVNEVTGMTDTLTISDVMIAVIPPLSDEYANVAITPLTHMAATRAKMLLKAGIPLATAIDASNVGVAQQYGLESIWKTLPADANNSTKVETAVLEQRKYGLVLAGIAQEASDLGVRPIDLVQALATDMEDGTLDGLGSDPIPVPMINGPALTLSGTAGTSDLQAAIKKFMQSGNNVTNLAGLRINTTPVNINPAGGSFYINAAPMPAWVENQGGTFTMTATGGTSPYTWSVPAGALPPWLTFNNGTFSGTPPLLPPVTTASISPAFPITCTDKNGLTQTISMTVTVVSTPPQLGWLQFNDPVINASYDQQIATGTGGMGSHYYCKLDTMGGFPPLGMVLTPDCHLKGKPSSTGLTKFRICVVDLGGESDCGEVGVTVAATGGGGGGGGGNTGGGGGGGGGTGSNCTCYCGWPANRTCHSNSDCPDDTSVPGTDVPGVCGCPTGC